MTETTLRGIPASPGHVAGPIWHVPILDLGADAVVPFADRESELATTRVSLDAVAAELTTLAAGLPRSQAGILEASVLMTSDPLLLDTIEAYVIEDGMPAARALLAATEVHADVLAAIDDPTLAARADDVRALGRQAAAAAVVVRAPSAPPPEGAVVVASDVGPGDVPRLAGRIAGFALAAGAATAHAAIVARSLGVPMVCALGTEILGLPAGELVVLDGGTGDLTVAPANGAVRAVAATMRARREADSRDRAERDRPAVTVDGRGIAVLANATSVAEVEVALGYGATGVGLVRTELAFLEATRWPTAADHRAAVEPLLVALAGRPAVVRVLDLGADKAPPFLGDDPRRGLALLLAEREGFEQQLEALLSLGAEHDLRLMLPLVEDAAQLAVAQTVIAGVVARLGCDPAPVGAMVETAGAADDALALADLSDFLSIGTNDLTAATLGEDRFGGSVGPSHHPAVLRHVAATVAAAHAAGIRVEVCGEAASTPVMAPLLVGRGVDELSGGAARVGTVRRWIRGMRHAELEELAQRALACERPEEVEALVATGQDDGGVR
jgi:phosphoenolpyruvate-protein kinase (PTS system EI component)